MPRAPTLRQALKIGSGMSNGAVAPAELLAGAGDLVLAERRAVGGGGAGLGRRAEADDRLAGDHRGLVGDVARLADGALDSVRIVPVDRLHVPAGGGEALLVVFRGAERGRAVDRDAVVVEQHDQPAEPEMAGQRDRLLADAFHQAAVAGDDVGVVIDDVAAEALGHQPLGEREAHGIAQALAQRAGGGLDAAGMAVLGMAGGLAAELAEVLQLVERHVGVAGEMQQRIEQHRAVAGRQDEAVAVGPVRLRGVELHELGEQHRGDVGHAHRHAGMARVRLLHGVHGESPDGVRHVAAGGDLIGHFVGCRYGFLKRGATCRPPSGASMRKTAGKANI